MLGWGLMLTSSFQLRVQPQCRLSFASCFALLVCSVDSLLSVPALLSDALSQHCVISMYPESLNPLKADLGLTPASSQSWCESWIWSENCCLTYESGDGVLPGWWDSGLPSSLFKTRPPPIMSQHFWNHWLEEGVQDLWRRRGSPD